MNEDSEIECTPPEVREVALQAISNLLPEKSKLRYENVYKVFKNWCTEKKILKVTESVLLAYFAEMGKEKKISSMWASFSILKSTLKYKENIDISTFLKLIAFLKKANVGYKPKKSKVFTTENIDMFMSNAPDEFLLHKLVLVVGISGACRTDELIKIKIEDIDILEGKILITIPDSKTNQSRSFVINNNIWTNIFKSYFKLRQNIQFKNSQKFFLRMRKGKIVKQPLGHNTLGQYPKKIADYLRLKNPELYTGHCFRRTAATVLANKGADILQLKRLGGWKSNTVAEGYVENSLDGQIKIANLISEEQTKQKPDTSLELEHTATSTSVFSEITTNTEITHNINC